MTQGRFSRLGFRDFSSVMRHDSKAALIVTIRGSCCGTFLLDTSDSMEAGHDLLNPHFGMLKGGRQPTRGNSQA